MAAENEEDLVLRVQAQTQQAVSQLDRLQNLTQGLADAAKVAHLNFGNLGKGITDAANLARAQQGVWDAFTSKLTGGFGAGARAVGEFVKAMGPAGRAAAVVGAAVSIAGAVTIAAAKSFGELSQQLDNSTKAIGVSLQFYQQLQVRLERLGLGTESARTSIIFFQRAVEQARSGVGDYADTLDDLKVAFDEARPTEDILEDFAKGLAKLETANQRVIVATKFFGRTGAAQIPVLLDMAAGGKAATEEMEKWGLIVGKDDVEAGKRFDTALTDIRQSWDALKRQFGIAAAKELAAPFELLASAVNLGARGVVRLREELESADSLIHSIATASVPQLINAFLPLKLGNLIGPIGQYLSKLGESRRLLEENKKKWDELVVETGKPVARDSKAGLLALLDPEQAKKLGDLSVQQLERVVKATEETRAATDAAKVAQIQRTKGEIASINERVRTEEEAAKRQTQAKLAVAADERKKTIEDFAKTKEGREMAVELEQELTTIREKGKADREQVAHDEGQSITSITIEADTKRNLAVIAVQKSGLDERLALHQINSVQHLEQTKALEDREIAIQEDGLRRKLALMHLEPAERKAIIEQIDALNSQQAEKDAAYAAQHAQAVEQYADSVRSMTERVSQYYEQAFGSEQQQRLAELARAHQDLVRELQRAGLTEEIDKVDAAYKRMVADAKGSVIDASHVVTQGIEDMFSGVLLGTRKSSDIWKGFKDSMVKQLSQGFAEALQKKLAFDSKFRTNVTEDLPGWAAQGAESIGANFSSVFDLLRGGSGVGKRISVDDGVATWVGGAPAAGSGGAPGYSQVPASVLPGASFPVASGSQGGVILSDGSVVGSASPGNVGTIPRGGIAGTGVTSAGLGSLGLSAGAAGLLFGALEGGGGPLGPVGPLAALVGLSGVPGGLAAVMGIGSPLLGYAGALANAAGVGGSLGGALSGIGASPAILSALGLSAGAVGAGTVLAPAAAAGTFGSAAGAVGAGTVLAPSAATGTALAGGGAGAAAGAISYLPIIGWIIAGIAASLAGSQYIDKTNKGPYGSANLNDKQLFKAFWSGVLGKTLGKSLGPYLGGALTGFMGNVFGLDPVTDLLKVTGIAHTPEPHSTAHRLYGPLSQQQWFKDVQNKYSAFGWHTGDKGKGYGLPWESEEFTTSSAYGFKGPAQYEKDRPLLEALGAILFAGQGQHPTGKGYPISSLHEFASSWIRDATNMGQATEQWKGQVKELTDQITGGNLPKAIQALNTLFDPKQFESYNTTELTDVYAKGVAAIAKTVVEDLPNAAAKAIEQIARAGKVNIDELLNFIDSVMKGADIARNSLEAAVQAATADVLLSKEERQQRADDLAYEEQQQAADDAARARQRTQDQQDERQRQFEFAQQQADREATVRSLDFQIQQAHAFGDEVSAAELEMQRDMLKRQEQAAAAAERIRRDQLAAQQAADADQERRDQEKADRDAARAAQLADPGYQFQQAMRKGIYDTVLGGIVDAFVQSGVIQVAIAPFFTALKAEMDTLSNPDASQDDISQAIARIGAAAETAYAAASTIWNRIKPILDNPVIQHLFDGTLTGGIPAMAMGGIVRRPTLAMIGEAGPEAVLPLSAMHSTAALARMASSPMLSAGGSVHVEMHLHAAVLDGSNARRLGEVAADAMVGRMRQQRMLGN